MQEQEKDFLEGYEIRNLDLSPRMYKMFALAAVINLIAIMVVGQTNMLARSACESPFVNRVCSVLDTVYFSSKILASDAGYVVKEYEETKIKESDVVWIDQTNVEPKLSYPEGYFQIANRDELAMLQQDPLAILPPDPILPPPPVIQPPAPRPRSPLNRPNRSGDTGSLIDGDLPDSMIAEDDSDKKPEDDKVADTNPEKKPNFDKPEQIPGTAPEIEINKKPLYDFVDGVVAKVNSNRVDLRQQFKVVMNAFITEEGKLDVEKSRWIAEEEEGNGEMILVAKDAVEKVGDSGWLVYLSDAGIKNVRIEFYQNEESLAADIMAIMPNENRARSLSIQFNTWVQGAIFAHNNNIKKFKDDELVLLRAADFEFERNLLKVKFNLKKDVAHPIINTRLKEYQADKEKRRLETPSPRQPNGIVEKSNAGNRAR